MSESISGIQIASEYYPQFILNPKGEKETQKSQSIGLPKLSDNVKSSQLILIAQNGDLSASKVKQLGLTDLLKKIIKESDPSLELNDQEAWRYFFENADKLTEINEVLKSRGFINPLEDPKGEISAWARQVTQGAKNDFEKFAKLKDALKKIVKYDDDPRKRKGQLQTAYDVFKQGFGDCGEVSNLFWVAAKALGFEVGFLAKERAYSNLVFVDGIIHFEIGHIYNWIKIEKTMYSVDFTEPDPLLGTIDPNDLKLSLQEQIMLHYLDSEKASVDESKASKVLTLAKEILPEVSPRIWRWLAYNNLLQATVGYLQGKSADISSDDLLKEIAYFLSFNPNDFALYYIRGLIYEKEGKDENSKELLNKAIESFEAALKENPYLIMAYYHLGSLYLELGAKDLALNAFKGLIQKFPKDFYTNFRLGEMLGEQGNLNAAEEYFKKASEIFENPLIHQHLSMLYAIQNKFEQSEEELNEAKDTNKKLLIEIYRAEVILYLKQLNFPKMEDALKQIKELDPGQTFFRLSLYETTKYLVEGNIEKAVENLKQALEKVPKNEAIYSFLGMLLIAQGNFEEAENLLTKGLTLLPSKEHSSLFPNLQILYLIQGKSDKFLESSMMIAKSYVTSQFGLKVKEVEQELEKMLPQIYDNSECLFDLGIIALAKGEAEKATGYFEKSIKNKPNENPACLLLVNIYLANKQWEKAEAILKTSQNEFAIICLSALYLAQKKYQKAEKILEKLIDNGTRNQSVYLQLWITYHMQGKKEEAKELFKQFIKFAVQGVSF